MKLLYYSVFFLVAFVELLVCKDVVELDDQSFRSTLDNSTVTWLLYFHAVSFI